MGVTLLTIALLIVSAAFTVLAILPFYTFNLRLGWLLSVLVTEYGQWFALVALAALVVALVTPGLARLAVPGLAASVVVFWLPTIQLIIAFPAWQEQLRGVFGPSTVHEKATVSLARLFFGRLGAMRTVPRRMAYADGLNLDFYPPDAADGAPWVLVVHGGGWNSGDLEQLPELNSYLASRGIGVASIDYRLAPEHPWPAARDDVRRAIAFVKARAAELKLDPRRWALLGRSAGGQLVQMVALTENDPTLKGCISMYAPSDMRAAYEWGLEDDILGSRPLVRAYMGGPPEERPERYREASALEFASNSSPPMLLLHGNRDPLVWIRHSERLRDHLRAALAKVVLIEVPWGTHGFDYNLHGPGGQTTTASVDWFLDSVFTRR